MDHIDARLMRLLQANGRSSFIELAQRLGLGRAAVATRLQRLLDEERLRIVGVIHPAILGLHVSAHIAVRARDSARGVAHALAAMVEAPFVSLVTGRFDVVAEMRVPDQAALSLTLARVRALPGVRSVDTLQYVAVVKDVLSPLGPPQVSVDERDRMILRALQRDGRTPFSELATVSGLTPAAARARVLRMMDNGVLHVTAVILRGSGHRDMAAGCGLQLRGVGSAAMNWLTGSDAVEFAARTTGRHDAVVTFSTSTLHDLSVLIDQLRDRQDVEELETWMHLEVVKEDYEQALEVQVKRDGSAG